MTSRIFKILALSAAALVASRLFARPGDAGYTPVKLYTVRQVEIKVERYTPPLLFKFGKLLNGGTGPAWAKAYYAFQNLDAFSYGDWIALMSKDIVAEYHIDPTSFATHQAECKANRDKFGHAKSTAFATIYVKTGERELCHVVTYNSGHLEKLPERGEKLPDAMSSVCFEKIGGEWEVQRWEMADWTQGLPFLHLDNLDTILKEHRALLGTDGRVEPFTP